MLPTNLGGYVGQDLPTANQGEALSYGFDFSPALSPDETISSGAALLQLLEGTDQAVIDSPIAYNTGAVVIDGSTIAQLLTWPGGSNLVGNVYALYLSILTSRGQAIAAWARIVMGRIG